MIKTKKEHQKALKTVAKMIVNNPKVDSVAGKKLLALAKEVSDYESKHFKFRKPSKKELAAFRKKEAGR